MRLIDADIAINMISDEIVTDTKVLDVFRALGNMNEVKTLNTSCERHIHMIEQLPTVDAVLVEHGRWIDVNGDGSLWRCSVCGETQCCNSNYCGECGAKMDMAVAYYADNKLVEKVLIDERKKDAEIH